SMYAVYHGPAGLKRIAEDIHQKARVFAIGCKQLGYRLRSPVFFDTVFLELHPEQRDALQRRLTEAQINLNWFYPEGVGISLDETTTWADVEELLRLLSSQPESPLQLETLKAQTTTDDLAGWRRTDAFLRQPVFHQYQSETEFLRYVCRLERRDLSLTTAMMPLGSCTMKLNATS
ncbi:MAG: hypothetical protein NZL92_12510, partial [Gloeomargarita sp. SKYG116]|nr:hypothetical protein [Gloeomargarita sp. SKYG116]MDW8402502.1 hypothetical protein [Gloeomargarita sp. SKYGB_i_bin116]